MSSTEYLFPVAVSQLGEQDSRESQNARAVQWLLGQRGGSIVVVTPQKQFDSDILRRLAARPGVIQLTWRGLLTGSLANHRVLYAWPNRKHLNDLWGADADALVVIEWGRAETATWIADANPVRLLPGETVQPVPQPAPGGIGRAVAERRRGDPGAHRRLGSWIRLGSKVERRRQAQGGHDELPGTMGPHHR